MYTISDTRCPLRTTPFTFPSLPQTMDVLKQRLSEDKVEYVEKVFATSESIAGLRSSPFVSQIFSYDTHCLHTSSSVVLLESYFYINFTCTHHFLQEPDIRVYVMAMYSFHARAVICEVGKIMH